jgi:hypothetical protein
MLTLPDKNEEAGSGEVKLYQDSDKKIELKIPNESILKNMRYRDYDGTLKPDQLRSFYDV